MLVYLRVVRGVAKTKLLRSSVAAKATRLAYGRFLFCVDKAPRRCVSNNAFSVFLRSFCDSNVNDSLKVLKISPSRFLGSFCFFSFSLYAEAYCRSGRTDRLTERLLIVLCRVTALICRVRRHQFLPAALPSFPVGLNLHQGESVCAMILGVLETCIFFSISIPSRPRTPGLDREQDGGILSETIGAKEGSNHPNCLL